MRTSFPSHSKKYSSVRARALVAICVLFVALFLFHRIFGAWSSYATAPLFAAKVWLVSLEDPLSSYFRSHGGLQSEIQSLKDALANARYDAARLAILEEEMAKLRAGTGEGDRIAAEVVLSPNATPYDTLLINNGADNGIKEGALVFAGKTAIGTVARAYPKSAFVVLFSTPDMVSSVYVYGARVFARAVGQGGGVVRIGVPQGVQLSVGDPVVVPVASTDIYGTIAYIESDPSNPEQYGYVTQAESLMSLRTVFVAREPTPAFDRADAERIVADLASSTSVHQELIETLSTATTTSGTTTSR